MDINNLPRTINWRESRLSTFREGIKFPIPLTSLWVATIAVGRELKLTTADGTLTIDSSGVLIWSMSVNSLPDRVSYDLSLISPDGTNKHYITGDIIFTK